MRSLKNLAARLIYLDICMEQFKFVRAGSKCKLKSDADVQLPTFRAAMEAFCLLYYMPTLTFEF